MVETQFILLFANATANYKINITRYRHIGNILLRLQCYSDSFSRQLLL